MRTDWYPRDVVSLIAGRAGEGKSSLALYDAARATRGELPGDYAGQPLTVAITAIEDTKSMQRARLEAAGADLDRIVFVDVATVIEGDTLEDRPQFPDDLDQIKATLAHVDARLWIIDPLSSALGGDTNRRDDVRRALDPLHALARDLNIAVVGITHFGKGQGFASEKISGSHAFRDVARSVLLVAADEESGERIVTLDKSNYSNAAGTSWKFVLEDAAVFDSSGEELRVGRVVELGETDMTVQQVMNRQHAEEQGDDRNAAQAFVLDYLKSTEAQEAPAGEVLKAGRAAGFNDSELKDARRRLKSPKVASRKSGYGAGWVWAVEYDDTEGGTKVAKVAHSPNGATFATLAENLATFDDPEVAATSKSVNTNNVVSLHQTVREGVPVG